MNERFLLNSELAAALYESVRRLPIIDYHNHIPLADLQTDRKYANLYELWIASDPYKHRLMRISGVPEEKITGDAQDFEKFCEWCRIFPMLMGTPVYDWCRMELWQVFGIDAFPCAENAAGIWREANEKLASMSLHSMLESFNVSYMSPVASVLDDVNWFGTQEKYAPSLRGDDAAAPTPDFAVRLAALTGIPTDDYAGYLAALERRVADFAAVGCKFADHALDDGFAYIPEDGKNGERYARMLAGDLDGDGMAALTCGILRHLGQMYERNGMILQLHIGAMRHTSRRLRAAVGAAGGYAAIGSVSITGIVRLLDDIEADGALPRTVIFPLDPAAVDAVSVLSGSFSRDGVPSIVSLGPAWWWCDHREGIRRVFESLTSYSVLSAFIGMTTDSRSVLSFVRHDYFRRILCRYLADKVQSGEFPDRMEELIRIAKKLSYENAYNRIREEF